MDLGMTSGMDSTCGTNENWFQRLVWYYKHDKCSSCCWFMFGLWSVRNPLESLGEILGSCFSGWDVIPW